LKLKSDTLSTFIVFHKFANLLFQAKLKAIQTNNEAKFKAFLPYLCSHGIQHCFTCPYTHQQNGVIKRKHKHITELGLTLLAHANMPLKF